MEFYTVEINVIVREGWQNFILLNNLISFRLLPIKVHVLKYIFHNKGNKKESYTR